MGVGLQPLEFTECLADSPHYRENLQRHEKELERTSQQIKRLIKEVKDVVNAAKRLSTAQLALASSMEQIEFACIGASMTEDERVISRSLHHFAHLMRSIEDERERMLGRANAQIIEPLERFRKEHIGAVKEGKKKFEKKTAKFCQTQERTLALSTKKPDPVFQEAEAAMEMAARDFCQASLEYAFQLQAVQERKKFELVETLLGFVYSWWTFHHTAHDVHADAEPLARDLQLRIQRTRSNFEETSKQTETLMKKMMEMRNMSKDEDVAEESGSRAGYLFLMEKKAFGTTWSKQYATYEKSSRLLTLLPYNQINVKSTATLLPSLAQAGAAESAALSGARPAPDAERRHCWEALPAPPPPGPAPPPLTLQALDDRDRAAWLRAVNPPHPIQNGICVDASGAAGGAAGCVLDEHGFEFVRAVIRELEARGLTEQGLYRVGGVASRVARLVAAARCPPLPDIADRAAWDSKTLTSALKGYLRALPEPLATRRLHRTLVAAMQLESRSERVSATHALLLQLPRDNYEMLHLVITHLRNVVSKSSVNLMTVSNVSVCFGPTLMWAERECVAAILELKFYNALVETLIENYAAVFSNEPPNLRSSPASMGVGSRTDLVSCAGSEVSLARYSHQHQQLLQHFPPPAPPAPAAERPAPPHVAALRGAGRSSSSSESISSGASPPPPPPAPHKHNYRYTRVRTLYACLGESEGELSFEPNMIITDVGPSAEPGWLRGVLAGRVGLVPSNYVEPLP